MESDDERASDSYSRLYTAMQVLLYLLHTDIQLYLYLHNVLNYFLLLISLQRHPEWDAACCEAECIGWDRCG